MIHAAADPVAAASPAPEATARPLPTDRLPLQGERHGDGRFRPGHSGNPGGRPRRAPLAGAGGRRLIPVEPTELEKVLAEPVHCFAADASGPVSLARAVVARLTERALQAGDIAACRELLRLTAEADAVRIERELLLAERETAEAQAVAEEARARDAAARQAAADEQTAARNRIECLADQAAEDAGDAALDPDVRALKLLEAVDKADPDGVEGVRPWVEAAARAHDPGLPRGARPLDPKDPWAALNRLEVVTGDEGEARLAGWFIDAARARLPDARFEPGDEALLQWIRAEDEAGADWVARLALVQAAVEAAAAAAAAATPDPDSAG
jgi:hypothetical protein